MKAMAASIALICANISSHFLLYFSGEQARSLFIRSKLPLPELSKIWLVLKKIYMYMINFSLSAVLN